MFVLKEHNNNMGFRSGLTSAQLYLLKEGKERKRTGKKRKKTEKSGKERKANKILNVLNTVHSLLAQQPRSRHQQKAEYRSIEGSHRPTNQSATLAADQ
jgi:hypothetical protein